MRNAWRYDDATGLLYQRFPNDNPGPDQSIVYGPVGGDGSASAAG